MKYIRTKDGKIFYAKKKSKKDVKLANDNLHWEAIPKGCNDYFTLDYEDNEIVKIADTIDDLLDGYICHKELVRDILVAKSYSKTYNLPIYGCIYVEGEGFIIVAKVVDILPDGDVSWSLKRN